VSYRIVTASKVVKSETVIKYDDGIVYLDFEGKPQALKESEVVAVLHSVESDVTSAYFGPEPTEY